MDAPILVGVNHTDSCGGNEFLYRCRNLATPMEKGSCVKKQIRSENDNAESKGHRGKEFWSRRPYFGEGKIGKMLTHRAERHRAKRKMEE